MRGKLSATVVGSLFVTMIGLAALAAGCSDAGGDAPVVEEEELVGQDEAAVIDPDTIASADLPVPDDAPGGSPHAGLAAAAACVPVVSPFRELEIVDPSVLTNARAKNVQTKNADGTTVAGHRSFRWMVEQMAPAGTDAGDFVLKMLSTWKTDQKVNGFTLPARPAVQRLIDAWPKKANGKLDLAKAPFRLIAIVYRPDLGRGCNNAGEGRFVFAVTNGPGDVATSSAQSFTTIFEYHLPTSATVTPQTWAKRWHTLNQPVSGVLPAVNSTTYRALLQGITDPFSRRGAIATAPNGNAISQVRTNEIAIASGVDTEWQLREFHLAASGFLTPATTAQTPDLSKNNTGPLHDLILDNKASINAGTFRIPATFLGGRSDESTSRNNGWMTTDPSTTKHPEKIDATTKRNFSMLTCNGCHRESQVTLSGFYHVTPFSSGGDGQANVSTFVKSDLTQRAAVAKTLLCSTGCVAPAAAAAAAEEDEGPVRVH